MIAAILFVDFICLSILMFYIAYSTLGDIGRDYRIYIEKRRDKIRRAIEKKAIDEANRIGVPVSDGMGTAWFPGGTTITPYNAPFLSAWKSNWRLP